VLFLGYGTKVKFIPEKLLKTWFEKEKLTPNQIFERLFNKMCQA
jgi:hypothetical protein